MMDSMIQSGNGSGIQGYVESSLLVSNAWLVSEFRIVDSFSWLSWFYGAILEGTPVVFYEPVGGLVGMGCLIFGHSSLSLSFVQN